mmetsp:Transcript_5516/g.23366  ORF Transcript_5516/g.23366 Transcript_5516/m.23366 type:complete len:236 (+) Transcript_5516:712-1419(+)
MPRGCGSPCVLASLLWSDRPRRRLLWRSLWPRNDLLCSAPLPRPEKLRLPIPHGSKNFVHRRRNWVPLPKPTGPRRKRRTLRFEKPARPPGRRAKQCRGQRLSKRLRERRATRLLPQQRRQSSTARRWTARWRSSSKPKSMLAWSVQLQQWQASCANFGSGSRRWSTPHRKTALLPKSRLRRQQLLATTPRRQDLPKNAVECSFGHTPASCRCDVRGKQASRAGGSVLAGPAMKR